MKKIRKKTHTLKVGTACIHGRPACEECRRGHALKWSSVGMFVASVTRDGRRLGVVVQPEQGNWLVMVLEATSDGDAKAVLDDHAHKVVGTYLEMRRAFDAAEAFAVAWLAGAKQTQATACECPELERPKTTKRRQVVATL